MLLREKNAKIRRAVVETLENRTLLSATLYENTFDSGINGGTAADGITATWNTVKTTTAPNGQTFAGQFTKGNVSLSLGNLGAHEKLTISFDLYIIRSWDGSSTYGGYGPDKWGFSIDGTAMLDATFSNKFPHYEIPVYQPQSFESQDSVGGTYDGGTGAFATGTLGYKFQTREGMDSIYRFTYTIDHSASNLVLLFRGAPNQDVNDESWGLDNVKVEATPPKVSVTQVEFSASSGQHVNLVSDYTDEVYGGPHWIDANEDGDVDDEGDTNFATAFASGSTPAISARLKVEGAVYDSSSTALVRASASNGMTFSATAATLSDGYLEVSAISADTEFQSSLVQYLPEFTLEWEVSWNGGTTWHLGGTSTTILAVTLGQIIGPAHNTPVLLSTEAADGATTQPTVTDKVWEEFSDRVVMQAAAPKTTTQPARAARQLTYWMIQPVPAGGHPYNTAEKLLQHGDGDCVAWSDFFIKSLAAQGVVGADRVDIQSVYPSPAENNLRARMLVKNWDFVQNPANIDPDGWSYDASAGEVVDKQGMAGQGNPNPPGAWLNHQIVRIGGKFYDPSYGGDAYASRQAWENASLAGFARREERGQLVKFFGKKNIENGAGEKEVEFWINGIGVGQELQG